RSAVVSVRENMYVHAAQSIGASTPWILWRHIMPNVLPPIIVLFTTRVGFVILAESGLAFLGLGVPPPTPTWGGMLSGSGRTFMFQGPWLALARGLCLTIVVYATRRHAGGRAAEPAPRLALGQGTGPRQGAARTRAHSRCSEPARLLSAPVLGR